MTLDLALDLTDDIQRAYFQAGPQERRLLNQGLFERIEIDSEEVVANQLAEPFDQLRSLGQNWDGTSAEASAKAKTPAAISRDGGLNVERLAPPAEHKTNQVARIAAEPFSLARCEGRRSAPRGDSLSWSAQVHDRA